MDNLQNAFTVRFIPAEEEQHFSDGVCSLPLDVLDKHYDRISSTMKASFKLHRFVLDAEPDDAQLGKLLAIYEKCPYIEDILFHDMSIEIPEKFVNIRPVETCTMNHILLDENAECTQDSPLIHVVGCNANVRWVMGSVIVPDWQLPANLNAPSTSPSLTDEGVDLESILSELDEVDDEVDDDIDDATWNSSSHVSTYHSYYDIEVSVEYYEIIAALRWLYTAEPALRRLRVLLGDLPYYNMLDHVGPLHATVVFKFLQWAPGKRYISSEHLLIDFMRDNGFQWICQLRKDGRCVIRVPKCQCGAAHSNSGN